MAALRQAPEAVLLSLPERQWRAAACLGWPLTLGAAPILLTLTELQLCAFRQLSGLPCPLCGGTHACAALLHGDLAGALQANSGVLLLLAIAALHSGLLAREAWSGRRFDAVKFWPRAWAAGGAILLLTWSLRLLGYA